MLLALAGGGARGQHARPSAGWGLPGLPAPDPFRTPLTGEPPWRRLEPLQGSMTRAEFEAAMEAIYGPVVGGWRESFALGDERMQVRMDGERPGLWYRLDFGTRRLAPAQRRWRTPEELGPAPAGRALEGMRVALDPGHIGGAFAKMEGRWMRLGRNPPVEEGLMALAVAQRLKKLLEAQGAQVAILRPRLEPVTPLRPADLLDWTRDWGRQRHLPLTEAGVQLEAERFFYRVAEIRARAQRLEEAAAPADVAICLHFNAAEWGDPQRPSLVDDSHLHILVNGCYGAGELRQDDQRMELLRRLWMRTHEVEIPLAETVAASCATTMRLRPFAYDTPNARRVGKSPYVWARNLLANRIFPCPVIYMEPYLMNGRIDYARMIAGAYEGTRQFGGVERINIYDEYAQAVAEGVAGFYRDRRGTADGKESRDE